MKPPSLDLSIIIVNWNTREMLRENLSSVFNNLGALKAEVIVIDNASEDGSPAMIAADFPDAILICNTENRGFAAANNQGFEIARGHNILMLNSDTLVLGDVLTHSCAYLSKSSNMSIGAMGCRVLNTDRTVQQTCSMYPSLLNLFLLTSGLGKFKRFGRYQMSDWARDRERTVEVISGCYLLMRRAALESVGPLDESFFFFGEETDWCARARDAQWVLRFAPVGEIIHHGSVSARKLNHQRDVLLTQALIRLHRKHNGRLSAWSAWLILFSFNASRACFWGLRGLVSPAAKPRAAHFRAVVRALLSAPERR